MTRLSPQPGERIDRARPLTFTFDGKPVQGYAGDTIVSALHASGRRVFSRSFKYHRPRGELCGCGQCASSLFDVDGRPGVRGCSEPAQDGMTVGHQNAWPSLEFDVMRATDKLGGPFTPVGFYYKTFIRPRKLWPVYEKVLRKAAGLGRLPKRQAEREWETEYRRRHCDVLVVGGGLSGLRAAIAAAERGDDVVLCDEDVEPGGVALVDGRHAEARALAARARELGVEILSSAPALGFFDGLVPVWQHNTLHQVRAPRHVLATGAIQQPLVFPDNDLPGVMLSGGARRLAALYAVKPGDQAVVATVDDRGLEDALALHAAGLAVGAVADLRKDADGEAVARLELAGIRLLRGFTIVRASGRGTVQRAVLAQVDHGGIATGPVEEVACDLVAVSGGAQPALSLFLQAGGRAGYHAGSASFGVEDLPSGMEAVGRAAGGATGRVAEPPALATDGARGGKAFVDLDEDVTVKDVDHAAAEGFDSLELSKRYTTVTMGPSQGRFSQIPAARAVARATGLDLNAVGLTTARPPWSTVPMGALAGRPFEPAKRSALHGRHRALDANVRWAGDWRRAYDYGDPEAEALAVQQSAGIIDVSTLGKLLVRGPDAGELLDRLYPNTMSSLAPGRIRYGVMTSDTGRITDDGTVCRLDDDTFYVTTTSAGAAAVEQQMTWWLADWELDARVTDLTQGVAAMNLAGPHARAVLSQLTDADCSNEAISYLDARHLDVAGVPALVLRIGFVGEVGYEIHCPAPQAGVVWDAIVSADDGATVRPFGLEPQRVLRLQKLHVIVGQDTDSESTPLNTGMEWIVKLDKAQDFIGRWALEFGKQRGQEVALVGFATDGDLPTEGAVVLHDGEPAGQVTSARRSPRLGRTIGMATVPLALATEGARLTISDAGRQIAASVTTRPFYDPDGEVLRS